MKHKTSNYISAFIIGGIAGGVIALSFAAYHRKELRERINSDLDNCFRKAKQNEEEIINKAEVTAGDIVTKGIRLSALIE